MVNMHKPSKGKKEGKGQRKLRTSLVNSSYNHKRKTNINI